jgi:hypothetical protein
MELWVGWPAVKTILLTRLLPGLGDWLAARGAYESQQTNEPAELARPDNLFAPVAGNFGAHGRFGARARVHSWQWSLSRHRWGTAALAIILLVAVATSLT